MLVFCGNLIKSHILFAWSSNFKAGMTIALQTGLSTSREDGFTHALRLIGPKSVVGDVALTIAINERL